MEVRLQLSTHTKKKKKKWLQPCPVDSFTGHLEDQYNLLHDQLAQVISIDHDGTLN